MIELCTITAFILGVSVGIIIAKRAIQNAITKADICSDDKRMIRDVLGIPNER